MLTLHQKKHFSELRKKYAFDINTAPQPQQEIINNEDESAYDALLTMDIHSRFCELIEELASIRPNQYNQKINDSEKVDSWFSHDKLLWFMAPIFSDIISQVGSPMSDTEFKTVLESIEQLAWRVRHNDVSEKEE